MSKSQKTHDAHHGEKSFGDIPTVLDKILRHDTLCAGAACLPFRIVGVFKKLSLGRKPGFEDLEQSQLFYSSPPRGKANPIVSAFLNLSWRMAVNFLINARSARNFIPTTLYERLEEKTNCQAKV